MTLIAESVYASNLTLEQAREEIARYLAQTHYKHEVPSVDSELAQEVRRIRQAEFPQS